VEIAVEVSVCVVVIVCTMVFVLVLVLTLVLMLVKVMVLVEVQAVGVDVVVDTIMLGTVTVDRCVEMMVENTVVVVPSVLELEVSSILAMRGVSA